MFLFPKSSGFRQPRCSLRQNHYDEQHNKNVWEIIRMIKSKLAPEIPLITKEFIPTGGVMRANSKLIINRISYQIGSTPISKMIGKIIGVVINLMAIVSSNIPKTKMTNIRAIIRFIVETQTSKTASTDSLVRPMIVTT